MARCAAHDLVYDASTQSGCVLCRRQGHDAGLTSGSSNGKRLVWAGTFLAICAAILTVAIIKAPRDEARRSSGPSPTTHDLKVKPHELAASREGSSLILALRERAPLSSLDEVQRRVGWSAADVVERDEDYDVAREEFDLYVPPSNGDEGARGLLVWIGATANASVPAGYRDVLSRQGVMWAAARNSGNDRKAPVRMNLALDVAFEVGRRYKLDPRRTWVGGMSGGARSASKVALLYPEVFAGGLFTCAADYPRDVPSAATGKSWRSGMPRPSPVHLVLAKAGRFLLLTGDGDPNRDEVTAVYRAYIADGFPNVQLVVSPNIGHELPSATVFQEVLSWLQSRP
jgi:predicted esterase